MYLTPIKLIVGILYIAIASAWVVRDYYEGEIDDGRMKRTPKD